MNGRVTISKRQLRRWGAANGGAFILVGSLVLFWRGHGWGRVPLALGILFALLGLTTVPPARPVYRAWHAFVDGVLWLWTRVALILTFVIAVIPVALIGRLIGRDRMQLRFPGGRATEWRDHAADDSQKRYWRQF